MNVGGYWFSDRVALKLSRAQPLPADQAPGLHQAVASLSQRAGIPTPQLYLIPSEQPNAFATGRNPEHAAVAVTAGLLQHLPADQVEGVLAHELAHIKNRDILVSSIAATIAASISGIATFLQFSWLFGGEDDESPLGLIGTLAAIILAPIAAMLLQLAVSRQREYLADATAAELMGTPRPLMDALGTPRARHEADPDAGAAGDGLAVHREPAARPGDDVAVLDAPPDGGADPAPRGARPRRLAGLRGVVPAKPGAPPPDRPGAGRSRLPTCRDARTGSSPGTRSTGR